MPLSNTAKADLLFLVVTLLAAISWMFSKEAVLLMPPMLFIAIRFLLGGLLLGAIGYRELRQLSGAQCRRAIRVGIVFGFAMSCWSVGLHRIEHIGEGAFLTSLAVVLVPVMARLFFREAQPVSTWISLPVAVGGLALLSLENGFRLESGQVFFVAASVLFALYFNLNTHAAASRTVTDAAGAEQQERIPVIVLTAVVLTTVGVVAGTLSFLLEPWRPTWRDFSWVLAGWILASTLVGTAGRFLVQTWAQSLSAHSHGVVILVLEPVWVALIAALWFAETMSPMQFAGCMAIFAALIINRWSPVKRWLKNLLSGRGSL